VTTPTSAFSNIIVHTQSATRSRLGESNAAPKLLALEERLRQAAALIELTGEMESSDTFERACERLVGRVQSFLGCSQVMLGLCEGKQSSCRLNALAGESAVDALSERNRHIEAALDEAIIRGTFTLWPASRDSQRHALLAHKRLAQAAGVATVVSSPIRDEDGRVQGAWIFFGNEEFRERENDLNFIQAAETRIGACLALLKRTRQNWLQRCVSRVLSLPRTVRGQTVLVALGLTLAAMAVPLPYKVKCDCEVQPTTRRFVAAPFEGKLEKSFVEPGDLVGKDHLLAQIDGREIRWELAGASADFSRAAKQYDGHLAEHDFGDAQLSQLEMERLALKTKLLEHRTERLDIRSPIDGIVISGDLKKAEGVPLTVGQSLFEIAPLERMIVEIAVPEADIAHIAEGMPVRVAFESFPEKEWESTVQRIHPRSEIKNHEHVFVAELHLNNPYALLRPGMQGRAKITSHRHPLGWNLFHKPWEQLVFWLGW
jgi:hypothetical protein